MKGLITIFALLLGFSGPLYFTQINITHALAHAKNRSSTHAH